MIEASLEPECKKTIDMLEKATKITNATDEKRNELEQDAKEFISVASEKMSQLSGEDLAVYKETGNTPINKPISKPVDLVRSLPDSVMRETYKLLKQSLTNCETNGRTSSSPKKRKTSDDESSSRSSIESLPTAPVVPAKKVKDNVKENVIPIKASNILGGGKSDGTKTHPSKNNKDSKTLQTNNMNLK